MVGAAAVEDFAGGPLGGKSVNGTACGLVKPDAEVGVPGWYTALFWPDEAELEPELSGPPILFVKVVGARETVLLVGFAGSELVEDALSTLAAVNVSV